MGGSHKRHRLKKRAANRCVQGAWPVAEAKERWTREEAVQRGARPRGERCGAKFQKIHATASQTVTTTRDKRHGVRCRNDSRSCPPHMAKMRRSIACGGGRGPTGCARWYSTLVSMRSRLHFFPPVHQSVCVSQALVGVPRLASPPDWPPSVDLERCPVQRAKGSVRVLPAWDRLRVRVRVRGQG